MPGGNGVTIRWDSAALAATLRGPDGPVLKDLIRRGERVKDRAKQLVGVHQPVPGERRTRRPGTLRDSIVKRVMSDSQGFYVAVIATDEIALWHHEGTRPHVINGNPFLVFYWPKVGKVVYLRRVNHPGTRPNRFLVDALDAIR